MTTNTNTQKTETLDAKLDRIKGLLRKSFKTVDPDLLEECFASLDADRARLSKENVQAWLDNKEAEGEAHAAEHLAKLQALKDRLDAEAALEKEAAKERKAKLKAVEASKKAHPEAWAFLQSISQLDALALKKYLEEKRGGATMETVAGWILEVGGEKRARAILKKHPIFKPYQIGLGVDY